MHTWKESLFVWSGRLTLSDEGRSHWEGTWVSTTDPNADFPSDADFAESANHFKLISSEKLDLSANGIQLFDWDGHYMLDNGDGPRSHSDYSHHCCLHRAACLPSKVTHMVVAKGETEFGVFISVGILEEIDDTGPDSCREHKLTLSRRYVISDRDPRFRSSLERRAVSDSIYLPRPWENLPLRQRVVGNSDADNRSSKRKRGDES